MSTQLQELSQQFETRFRQLVPFEQEPRNLYEPCAYLLQLGGKRIRPVLCLMAAQAFDADQEDAYHIAAAIELFHNFTLIHDDIMDDAPLRRGHKTVHEKWNINTGILSGDAMLILAYQLFEEKFGAERWTALSSKGANKQRPLWASTGVKDPAYPDTLYVVELIAPETVNTMPQSTLDALIDHGVVRGNTISGNYAEAVNVLKGLSALGISLDQITTDLEIDGVKKFAQAWDELLENVKAAQQQ